MAGLVSGQKGGIDGPRCDRWEGDWISRKKSEGMYRIFKCMSACDMMGG